MLAIATAVLVIPSAFAVHDTGYFEMEGNAVTDHTGAGIPDDWDRVCFQATGNSACGTSNPTNQQPNLAGFGSTAVSWTGDCPKGSSGYGCNNANATIFTGGGSKDPQNINQWAWKDGAGGLPDKDNLVHAFAARYSIQGTNASGTCPNGTDNSNPANFDPSVHCEVIFFGSDRFDNSGDAQQGFWFLQNSIGLGSNSVGGGSGFTSNNPNSFHRNGDLLVVSDFSNGGATATITVFKWDATCTKAVSNPQPGQCGDVNLRELETSTNALCSGSLGQNDAFCGITNPSNGTTAPWSTDYTDKSGNHTYLQGELFEAGVNLSTLGLGGECFSSVLSETRSSTSTTATLKDFVLGSFAPCGATIHTTPSADTTQAGSVSPGTPVTDTATVAGTGVANPPFPSSPPNVTFILCDPTTVTANGGNCTTGGSAFGNTKALTQTATQGVSSATSDQVNTVASPLTPGTYCFRAEWGGDSNYPGLIKDGASTECFTVRTIPTTTTTTPWSASDATGHALGTGTLALGTTLFDKAVVQGSAAAGSPPGNVNFFVCDPTQTAGTAGNETCPSPNGTALSGNPRALSADSGSSPPTSTAFSSPGVVANKAGVWCFRAEYVHSGSTYEDSHDSNHTECVTVGPEDTTTTTTPKLNGANIVGSVPFGSTVTDHAVVAAIDSVDGVPTGTVDFFICDPSVTAISLTGNCASGGVSAGAGKTLSASNPATTPPSATADSDGVTANVVGLWCFRAVYTPGGANGANYNGSSDPTPGSTSTTECFTVPTVPTTTTTTPWSASDATGHALGTGTLALGTTLFDKAVVQGSAAAGSPPGNVNFFVCDPTQTAGTAGNETCPSPNGTALSGNPRALSADSGSSPPTSTAFSSPGVVANKAGVWCFRAEYVHSGSVYQDSHDSNHTECVTVGPEDTTTTTTPLLNGTTAIVGALPVGSSVSDHAVVAAIDNVDGVPTGTVDFFICNPDVTVLSSTGNCASGGVSAGAGKTLSASNPATNPPSATADSNSITANKVGLWCFRAVYTPGGANGANYNGSSDPAADSTSTSECFLVQDSTSMASQQSWVPNDTATVTATGGTALNGTLSIQLYEGTCNANQTDVAAGATAVGSAYTQQLVNATTLAARTLTTNNSTPYAVGTAIAWLVKFTPDGASNVTGSQHCEYSSVSITN